jgi:hypothetical protein
MGAALSEGIDSLGFRGGWLLSAILLLGGIYLLRAAPMVVHFAYAADDDRG